MDWYIYTEMPYCFRKFTYKIISSLAVHEFCCCLVAAYNHQTYVKSTPHLFNSQQNFERWNTWYLELLQGARKKQTSATILGGEFVQIVSPKGDSG